MRTEIIELFTVQQLAEFIHKKPSSVYSDLSRRPESLPPVFRAPGSSKPLFINPRQWVSDLVSSEMAPLTLKNSVKPKRGRPTNAEIAARKAGGES